MLWHDCTNTIIHKSFQMHEHGRKQKRLHESEPEDSSSDSSCSPSVEKEKKKLKKSKHKKHKKHSKKQKDHSRLTSKSGDEEYLAKQKSKRKKGK